ncbi:MAG: FtsW/RodA/SpoVE family cell cycle protein [Waddliaceae bacterium]
MLDFKKLSKIDFRLIPVLGILMLISLLVISCATSEMTPSGFEERIFTPYVVSQAKWFFIGTLVFICTAAFDYRKLHEWTWLLYALMIITLLGLFFTKTIVGVQRWYRIPLIGISFQPSETAKLIVVITLSWFLERYSDRATRISTLFWAGIIVGIPFLLILKQPDLGSSLVLIPMTLMMLYFGNIHPKIVKGLTYVALVFLIFITSIFLGLIPHEIVKPMATKVLKEYQLKRLEPGTHHQKASETAIAIGGLTGTGWRKAEYTSGGWLPAAWTDSVFPSYAEQFGLVGVIFLISLFYILLYLCFQVTAAAPNLFGRLLAAGITGYIAIHILINIGMMTGFLPITGVPLVLISYGGTSTLITMAALGLLQSIYSRRFMF